jgi:hypothetical protein
MPPPLLTAAYFLIVAISSMIGAISGIGGGVIIKPVMDSLGAMSVAAISFLSGCTVLTMSTVSLLRNLGGEAKIQMDTSPFLAIGAVLGGTLGKALFQYIKLTLGRDQYVGAIQAVMLLAINIGVFLFMLCKARITATRIRNKGATIAIGLSLGLLSSFLGIGGGPVNIAVLYYFYSMRPKETTLNSLFIIFCSQAAGLATSIATRTIPAFPVEALVVMCSGGVVGSLIGGRISWKVSDHFVERFFVVVLIILMGINIYNIGRFSLM